MVSATITMRETDAQLVARMREGDLCAFGMIVQRYRAAVVARARARVGSLADAEDVAQDAFVQAYFHMNDLSNPESLLPWLGRVTDRFALMRLRKRREEPMPSDFLEMLARKGVSAQTNDIEPILADLPKAMRDAVSLTLLSGYTCAEAAVILGVREGTVKSRLSRARTKLKEVLGVTDRDADDFTRRTIERLRIEARRLVAAGNVEEASARAEDIISEQIKPLFGDPRELGLARTALAAYDTAGFAPDEEAVEMLGLPYRERRRRECTANAAQYGFRLEDLDWELAEVNVMSCTLGRPTGHGRDTWGVPISRMPLDIVDIRALCQRLRVSPLLVWEWVKRGAPILRCWPFARFDAHRVGKWLADNSVAGWPTEDEHDLEWPIRVIFRGVYEGAISHEQAEEIMRDLGYGAWEAPMSGLGGW